jgi:hypothetical protein
MHIATSYFEVIGKNKKTTKQNVVEVQYSHFVIANYVIFRYYILVTKYVFEERTLYIGVPQYIVATVQCMEKIATTMYKTMQIQLYRI